MSKKKPYYPNKWRAIKKAPLKAFEPLEFDDFMDWKIAGWQIPNDVLCIIRETNPINLKTKEYIYKREHAAKNKLNEIMNTGNHFVICTHDELQYMKPEEDWNDEDY